MSFRTILIKSCFESGIDNLLEDFYIPVLTEAISYDRIAGFFSSTSLAIAAKGILGLVKNNGKMRLLVSPKLTKTDIDAITRLNEKTEEVITSNFQKEIAQISDTFSRDHIFALGWLLKRGLLELKVALVLGEEGNLIEHNNVLEKGLFHQKVGILSDFEGNVISFSGSINETSRGWLENIEEFKVFKSWEPGQIDFLNGDLSKFSSLWDNSRINVRTVAIPEAIKNQLIENAPDDLSEILSLKRYREHKKTKMKTTIDDLELFEYQKRAVDTWVNNNQRLIFEMATGTGKTRTAISCIVKSFDFYERLITIIACPQNTLLLQWKNEINKLNLDVDSEIIADSTNSNWRVELENAMLDLSLEKYRRIIVYTTHATSSSNDFIEKIQTYKRKSKIFFIGDEVHGLGAFQTKRSLIDCYDTRLGLSATPRRWYDDIGTDYLYDYFGNKIFEFSLKDALNTTNPKTNKPYLVNYYYHPIFTTLTDDELQRYAELTKKVTRLSRFTKKQNEYQKLLENLIFLRANIHKSAENKLPILAEIIGSISNIKDMIIFVSPEQLTPVLSLLKSRGIRAHEFTEKQGTRPEKKYNSRTERQFLVDKFKQGVYQVLVAIKCLDEGLDIPSAQNAILLASSTNPREYVQRLGRILRQNDDKQYAEIFDVIIRPNYEKINMDLSDFEKKIFLKEMDRAMEISENALNNAEASTQLINVLRG